MKKLLLVSIICLFTAISAHSQGCVAIRSTGGLCSAESPGHSDSSSWLFALNNRYFKSFRHFVGTEEQKHRMEEHTEVINHAYSLDLFLQKNLNRRWSVFLNVPILANTRSSLYEHGGKSRHSTHSFGLGDIRFGAYAWVVDPIKMTRANVQVGLGLKLATGDYKFQDFFRTSDTTKILGPVDQSIQLGDGGTGITFELNAFYNISERAGLYGNFYYLSSPREQNGVSTARGKEPSASAVLYGSDVMSVPDQYMIRAGFNYVLSRLTLSAGVRDECLPVYDLIGGSNGFRRPGYIISVEPGINYQFSKWTAYASVPVAIVRSRTQSVPDKIRTNITKVRAQGDAAFADYVVNLGVSVRF